MTRTGPERQPQTRGERTVEASETQARENFKDWRDKLSAEMGVLDGHLFANRSDRLKMATEVQKDQYMDIFRKMEKEFEIEWEAIRNSTEYAALSNEDKLGELIKLREKYNVEGELAFNLVVGKLRKLSKSGDPLTNEQVAELRNSVIHQVDNIAEHLVKGDHHELLGAYAYLLGKPLAVKKEADGSTKAFVWNDSAAHGILIDYLSDPTKAHLNDTTFEALYYVPEKDRVAILKTVKGKVDAAQPGRMRQILRAGIRRGVITVENAEAVGASFDEDDKERLKVAYKKVTDFAEPARYYAQKSYQARSAAHDLDGRLGLTLVAGAAGFTTAVVNLGAQLGNQGSLKKNPIKVLTDFMKSGWGPAGAALAYASHQAIEPEGLGNIFSGGEKEQKKNTYRRNLASMVGGPHGAQISHFFEKVPRGGHNLYLTFLNLYKNSGDKFNPDIFTKDIVMSSFQNQKEDAAKAGDRDAWREADSLASGFKPIFESEMSNEEFLQLAKIVMAIKPTSPDQFKHELALGRNLHTSKPDQSIS